MAGRDGGTPERDRWAIGKECASQYMHKFTGASTNGINLRVRIKPVEY